MSISSAAKFVTFTGSLLLCSTAFSQIGPNQVGRPPVNRYSRPVVSPYLNLLDNQNSFEFNYFQRYKPQVEFRRDNIQNLESIQSLQRQVDRQRKAFQSEMSALGPTGHTATFLNTGSYFPRAGQAGGAQPTQFGIQSR